MLKRAFRRLEKPWARPRGVAEVVERWGADGTWKERHLESQGSARTRRASRRWPPALAPGVVRALNQRGIDELYSHQARALELASQGKHVVVATPTRFGQEPLLQPADPPGARVGSDRHSPLPLSDEGAVPRSRRSVAWPDARGRSERLGRSRTMVTLPTMRDGRRGSALGVLLTNPDMLHAGIMPHHTGWARLFSNLKYVVVDELHTYRGVFGSHLANVMRRLLRIARFHGSSPTFLFASATIWQSTRSTLRASAASRWSSSSKAARLLGLGKWWSTTRPVINAELGMRQSYIKTAVRLTQDLVRAGVPTLVFGNSRNGRRGDAQVPARPPGARPDRPLGDSCVPRWLSAADPPTDRRGAPRRRDSLCRRDQCARARHRHRCARCRRVCRVSGDDGRALAAISDGQGAGVISRWPCWSRRVTRSTNSWRVIRGS